MRKQFTTIFLSFFGGVFLYLAGVLWAFENGSINQYSNSLIVFLLTVIAGFGVLGLGYESVLYFGGKFSLRLAASIARITSSKHIIEEVDEKSEGENSWIAKLDFMLIFPSLVFIISAALDWDIHNIHSEGIFHTLLHTLDVFAKPIVSDPWIYSLDVIPVMILLTAIAGVVPSIALPYFRKFKITGVNSGPFHINLLTTVLGLVAGLGAIFSLIGLFYRTLWVNTGPNYYHYILPAMLGLSLHYSIGAYLGRTRSEDMIKKMLNSISSERIIKGKVNIRKENE